MVSVTQWYGDVVDTPEGDGDNVSAVVKINAYADSTYIYGFKIIHDDDSETMFGQTHNLSPQQFDPDSTMVKVSVHRNSGVLRGLDFFPTSGGSDFSFGYLGTTQTTAIDDAVLLDIKTSSKTLDGVKVICAVKFFYIDAPFAVKPVVRVVDNLALTGLGVLAHSYVLAYSLLQVGKLRRQLNVKAPSCDPPSGTDQLKVDLWCRTFRAQENTKEAFALFVPMAVIASVFGYRAFGEWAPRAVGVLALVGAYFRYKYVKGYIEDADKRGKPFGMNMMISVRPVALLAVASCGYLVGRQLYRRIKSKRENKS